MTHVSGIKTVAGTEKILVPKILIHSVKRGGGKVRKVDKKEFARSGPKAGLNFTGCGRERSLPSLPSSFPPSQPFPLLNTSCKSLGGP